MGIIYADNNATTQVAPEVYEAMVPFLVENYYNPSSMYEMARTTADAVADARARVAGHVRAKNPKEILFTSCATESNNAAIVGVAKANLNRRHIITTSVEHPAVLEVCKALEREGYEVTFLPVDGDGKLDTGEFVRALRSDTLLVTIMHVNNETGVIFPIEELSRVTKETDPGIVFHTDATQSVGKLDINLRGNLGDFAHCLSGDFQFDLFSPDQRLVLLDQVSARFPKDPNEILLRQRAQFDADR